MKTGNHDVPRVIWAFPGVLPEKGKATGLQAAKSVALSDDLPQHHERHKSTVFK
jgi:hypothetical protein